MPKVKFVLIVLSLALFLCSVSSHCYGIYIKYFLILLNRSRSIRALSNLTNCISFYTDNRLGQVGAAHAGGPV